VASDDFAARNPSASVDVRPLGICWVIYGILRLIMAVWLVSFSRTATVMFGALLARLDPVPLMSDFHLLYSAAVVLSAVCGLFALLAGLALLSGGRSAGGPYKSLPPATRMLSLIAGFLSLSNLPLGTTLGIYTLVVCLR
jgi:hypothetical protein